MYRRGNTFKKSGLDSCCFQDFLFYTCHRLRNDERTSHIPVIMLTARADFESKMEGLTVGANAYLGKPFKKEELLLHIKNLLELRRNLRQFYLKQSGLAEKSLSPTVAAPGQSELIADTTIEDAFVRKVREVVETHLTDANFTVADLCKYVFMSQSQLYRKLDALTGWSPNKFIRMIRLNKAKELVKNQDVSIASIAFECGYDDPAYFSRVFKQEFDVSPQEWRAHSKAGS